MLQTSSSCIVNYRRSALTLLISTLLIALFALPALAGGWAVVTVDNLPRSLHAGTPITLGFIVRQHGVHLVNLKNVYLTAHNPASGQTLKFSAQQQAEEGHYGVEVNLPTAGLWEWKIQPDWFPESRLVPIAVYAPKITSESSLQRALLPWILLLRRPEGASRLPTVAATLSTETSSNGDSVTAESDYGRALFQAKGCNSCHLHAKAFDDWSTESGPNLTNYAAAPEYLRIWLKNPIAIKPKTFMPNLGLKEEEIHALVAFLNQ